MSVKVSGTVRIEIDNKVIELSRFSAKQLLDALKVEFEQSPLNYHPGVRNPIPNLNGPHPDFPYPAGINEITCNSK